MLDPAGMKLREDLDENSLCNFHRPLGPERASEDNPSREFRTEEKEVQLVTYRELGHPIL